MHLPSCLMESAHAFSTEKCRIIYCVPSSQALLLGYSLRRLSHWASRLERDLSHPLALGFDDPHSVQRLPCPSVFEPPSKTLTVVIPAYNEEGRLGATLDEALAYLEARCAHVLLLFCAVLV